MSGYPSEARIRPGAGSRTHLVNLLPEPMPVEPC